MFALVSLWSGQCVLFHWAAPGYLMLFPLLGRWIAERTPRPWMRRTVAGTAALLVTVLVVIATQLQFDWAGGRLAGVLRKDPTAEGLDWTSVRDDLRARGLLRPGLPVAAFNWRDAGKFGHALGPDTAMLCLSPDAREFGFAHTAATRLRTSCCYRSVRCRKPGAGFGRRRSCRTRPSGSMGACWGRSRYGWGTGCSGKLIPIRLGRRRGVLLISPSSKSRRWKRGPSAAPGAWRPDRGRASGR